MMVQRVRGSISSIFAFGQYWFQIHEATEYNSLAHRIATRYFGSLFLVDGSWFHVDLLCPPVWNPTSTRLLEAEALTLCEASTRSVTEFVAAARCYWLKVHSSSLPFDSGGCPIDLQQTIRVIPFTCMPYLTSFTSIIVIIFTMITILSLL